MSVRFDERVAMVTGAGNGLGRSYALALAERGARVVVNDLGGERDGSGGSGEAAAQVVETIRAAGGEAIADGADVSDPEQVEEMVARALETWGRVDVLINNAGILRDKTFLKMDLPDFRAVVEVHLLGSVHCSKAVWPSMQANGYGRIVMTTSSSGLYGNFGQANYSAAKMAVVGLMNTLGLEGEKHDIRVNCLAPAASTRMTADLLPARLLELLAPESVAAGLLVLAAEQAPNRTILSAGAGSFARTVLYETAGAYLPPEDWTPERVLERWDEITDPTDQEELEQGGDQAKRFLLRAAHNLGLDLTE